jgi:hypothetical protein
MPRPRSVHLLLVGSLAALGLAACSNSSVPATRATATDVPFTSCDQATCTGEINGAKFEIVMPDHWNGTLLLWSHGTRPPQPLPLSPDEPVDTDPEVAPGSTPADVGDAGQQLLTDGFALAGSAYKSNGWAVDDGVAAGEDLHQYFVDNIATPQRTIVWGASLGGLVTALLEQRDGTTWVDGAAPMCGVLGGGNDNLDLALDVTYGIKQLMAPQLQLTGYRSWADATRQWAIGYHAVLAAGKNVQTGVPEILFLAAIADAAPQTKTYDGADLTSQVEAYGEAVVNALTYGTLFRSDIESRVGGNPSENTTSDYAARITPDERSLIDAVGGPGTTAKLLAKMAAGTRVNADPTARAALAPDTPAGVITDPVLTVHTRADPLVIAQNETLFADRVNADPHNTGDLVQAYTVAPTTYPPDPGAPYGAGHCNFTTQTYVGTAELMDNWVRNGIYPANATVAAALGSDSGYSPAYAPGPWPAQVPTDPSAG